MLISSFYPLIGGAEKQAQRLSKELVKNGHEVVVLTRMPNKGIKETEMIDGIKVIRLKVLKTGKMAPLSYLFKSLIYLFKNRKNIDVVHAHSLSTTGFTASLATFLLRIPSISKIAGGGNELGCEAKRMYIAGGLKRFRILFMNRYLSKYIAISNDIKKDLEDIKAPQNKIIYLPNGINIEEKKFIDIKLKKEELNLPLDKTLYLYAGRLEFVKGIDIILKSWLNTSSNFRKKSQLIILGEGTYNVEKYLSIPSISIIGKVNNVNEYLTVTDYFTLPSRYEGISNALLEAITHKVAVIASDAGGNKDIVNNTTGFLFEKENDLQLTKLLEETMEIYQGEVTEKVENAFLMIKENYDLNVIRNKYEDIYLELN